ncbi:unnamed protein product [Allacma fusca]|uniref:Uncharacterized protein n=1 Tax=Allacma fusca TaxID=39272 RepID=A0A8J2PTI0_9HEXA|nr:unnamed protein product [Allacma fusca]
MSRTIVIFVVLWISCISASSEIVKRAAIVSQTKSLDSDANDLDSIFVTKREKYYGRSGRTMNLNNETQPSTISDDNVETSRKASPDVQDIIDGIVKLLGGKVHQAPTAQAPTPPQIPPSAYNLFNPTKPVGKPSRINNRGPPVLPDPRPQPQGINRPLLIPENNNNHHHGQPIPQYQERPHGQMHPPHPPHPPHQPHPPHMLDNRPTDRQPMTDNRPHLDRSPTTEYRPIIFDNQKPNRPSVVIFQDRPHNSEDNRPGTTFEAIPLELLSGFDNKTKLGPPFPLPTVGYKPVPVSAEAPFRKGIPLPEQLVPPKFGPPQNNNHWPKVPSPPTIPPLITEEPKIIVNNKEIKSETPLPTTKKPTSLLVPVQVPTTTPQPVDVEDDEAEEDTVPIRLEPTIKDTVMEIAPTIVSSIDESTSEASSVPYIPTTSEFPVFSSSVFTSPNSETFVQPTKVQEVPSVQPTSKTTTTEATTTTTTPSASTTTFSHTGAIAPLTSPTPPLRPGIVLNDALPHSKKQSTGGNQGYGSVEVVTAVEGHGQIGDIFDVTVTAKQHYGGQATGQPFIIPVDIKDDVITHPSGDQQFVSIDGKRQYFNLHTNPNPNPNTAAVVGSVTQTQLHINGNNNSPAHGLPPPIRPVSTTLNIAPNPNGNANAHKVIPSKMPPNLVRRPITRKPSVPPVRIDTCIVGDDSTCNADQFEICRTESGVSSCLCRAGYARRRHREPCKAVVSMVLSMRLDKLGDKKLSYNPDYFNPNSELYQTLEWETIHAMDTALVDTNLHPNYVGAKLDAIGFDGRHAVVNSTVLIQENPKMNANQIKRELQRQLVQSITRNRNNFGKSQLWVEGPISAVAAITDVNECENPDLNDCDEKAKCVNTFGSFECKCEPGYGDHHEKDKRLSGRKCETCSGKSYCNGRGECSIEKGQRVCKCSGNFYGSQCDIDGEVLAVAIGASVSAVVIIGLTLACLCMWSRRWKREEQKAAVISRTLFGGMASQALSYLSKNTMNSSNPYQQHVTMDDRLRWAQVADTNLNGNIYVQNEPMSLCSGPTIMDTRRSAETLDSTVDDIFDIDRHPTKRPRSRSSQMQSGGIYYDLEPQSEMYASSPMVPFPAQFCVPSMNPYVQRGYYN